MAITLTLRVDERHLIVSFDNQAVHTPLDQIPAIDRLQADPFTNGQVLTTALGGDEILHRLAEDPDNLILLDCDERADAFAWEFSALPDRQFLCVRSGILRTVPRNSPPVNGNGPLNFIALAADPLVDEKGSSQDGYRLDLDNEMRSIRETLQNSGKNLSALRIPPTREHLNRALRQGPAMLHLTCHGNVVNTPTGALAVLALENKDGSQDPLTGADLLNMSPRGVLRMVLLSSCMTATGSQANLARALALNGVPVAIGMQESFPDPLSDELAVVLYESVFLGLSIGEALRQVRMGLARYVTPKGYVVGLPVGYVAVNAWSQGFPIVDGKPSVGGLGKPGVISLGGEIQPPRPLLGRNLELHQIARLFAQGRKVITVAGTGGMGKTALAAAFAERFAWIWPRGVHGYSFANEVNAANFRYALMRVLFGEEGAQKDAGLSENQQREIILSATREWNGLWLFDNYESVMQIKDEDVEARTIHRLIADLANGDAAMLLTSREQPAGLRNELLYPEGNHALDGLSETAGVEMFFEHSVKAKEGLKKDPEGSIKFAISIQRTAEGHPLAIALLAGEYDVSPVSMAEFLNDWPSELRHARRTGLAGHHVTFTTAFERSFSHLTEDLQHALSILSIFPFPFFAQAWSVVNSQSSIDDETLVAAKQALSEMTRRSLLEVDATYEDDTPATYRFQPTVRQEAAQRLDPTLITRQQSSYAAYGAWLAKRGYGDIHSDLGLNRVVRLSMDAMEKATDSLQGTEKLWHIRRLGWLKNAWGETRLAFDLVNSAISQNLPDPQTDPESAKVESAMRFELAGICVTRGDLDRALSLYEESLQLKEQLGDKQGKAASLSNMAQVFLTRGDLDRALSLYEESLQLDEQLGDKKGKAASLHQMAQVFLTRGDLDRALSLYEESLQLEEQLGDKKGKAASLSNMAQVFLTRGDLDRALSLYEESLQLKEQLGDKQGKAASLSNMAQVFLTRGDLDRALSLYEESLQLEEQLGDKKGKAASLSNMAQVFLTRGDLDRALSLYEESLQLEEQLGDKKGKAASLSNMAQVFLTRGDLDRALSLYEESLQLKEQLGDKQGKAASLHQMAQVFLTRGDLDRALSLYEESLQLDEQLGDKKGKAASLHQMAQVFLTRGDLDRALSLYEESLQLKEQLGDKQGKGTSLSMLGNLYMMKEDFVNAEKAILESLEIAKELAYVSDVAFNIVKLGQVAQARGDKETALLRYSDGLALFEKLGARPLIAQVNQLIASLEGNTASNGDPLAQFIARARDSAERKDNQSAIHFQEQAVELARRNLDDREALVTLSVTLYNLAGYYGNADRYEDAVKAMEEVVSIDEQIDHQDLESDREKFEAFQRIASLTPEERAALQQRAQEEQDSPNEGKDFEAQLQTQLAQLPPEQRAQAEAQIRKAYEEFQRMSPEQKAAVLDQQRRAQIDNAANQARDAGLAYARKQAPRKDILEYLNDMAQKAAEGEEPGSPWLEVAALCLAFVALIREEAIPPVAAVYVAHFSAVQSELKKG